MKNPFEDTRRSNPWGGLSFLVPFPSPFDPPNSSMCMEFNITVRQAATPMHPRERAALPAIVMVPFFFLLKLFLFFPTERCWLSFRSFACCHHNWNLFTVGFTVGCGSNCSLCWSCTELVCRITMYSSWREGAVSRCKVCQLFSSLFIFPLPNGYRTLLFGVCHVHI